MDFLQVDLNVSPYDKSVSRKAILQRIRSDDQVAAELHPLLKGPLYSFAIEILSHRVVTMTRRAVSCSTTNLKYDLNQSWF